MLRWTCVRILSVTWGCAPWIHFDRCITTHEVCTIERLKYRLDNPQRFSHPLTSVNTSDWAHHMHHSSTLNPLWSNYIQVDILRLVALRVYSAKTGVIASLYLHTCTVHVHTLKMSKPKSTIYNIIHAKITY